jgi:peptidoglycan hydrolase CwlO-like protein
MHGFWAGVWRSRSKAVIAWLLISALLASVLYAFNWHTFYDTRRNMARAEARQIAEDVRAIARATRASEGGDEAFRRTLRSFLGRRTPRVRVWRGPEQSPEWRESNEAPIDARRTRLDKSFELAAPSTVGASDGLHMKVSEAIRPSLATALGRAWSFSIRDYVDDPAQWGATHLYNRSIPLYGYLFTILVVGFGTVRALHRDQVQLEGLHDQAGRIANELDELRARHTADVTDLRGRVGDTERQRDDALRERERLNQEITAVENEYGELKGKEAITADLEDERLRAIGRRKALIERELATHDAKVERYESELGQVKGELEAAEGLLSEVEERHDDLTSKLRERNKRIRELQALVQQAQKDAHELELDALQRGQTPHDDDTGTGADALEAQLQRWLKSEGHANVSFSAHSRTGPIETAFAKIDRDFVDRHFTHVVNPEYERGARRTIRVLAAPNKLEGNRHGELVIALDDDAGRTLGLRYDLEEDAPDPAQIGFVLALMLRARCREFRSFEIRGR